MDLARSCYAVPMRLYLDRPDILVPGQWHFSPPGAKVVPYMHRYASANWDPDERQDPAIGEKGTEPRRWRRGDPHPRFTGQNVCGTQRQWEEGSYFIEAGSVLLTADGYPACCFLGAPPPYGLAWNGSGVFVLTRRVDGQGGLEFDGAAAFGVTGSLFSNGGLALGGQGMGSFYLSAGGIELDGTGYGHEVHGLGGLELDGAAGFFPPPSAFGGIELDGTGYGHEVHGLGGLELDGAAAIALVEPSEGGLELDGEGEFS